MTRNILDPQGNIIGTMTLPASTAEETWQKLLSIYATNNPVPDPLKLINAFDFKATDSVTTSSSQPAPISGMAFVPPVGKYVVIFSGSIYTDGASARGEFGIYIDGTLVAETRRDISCALTLLGGLVTISLNKIGVGTYTGTKLDLNGAQNVDIRFKSLNGGTIGFNERTLMFLKVE